MNLSLKSVDVINLFAEDFAKTRSFYQEILGLPLAFENDNHAVFKVENMIVSLWDASAAPDLIAAATVADPEAGSRFVLAVCVDDADAACRELARLGVVLLNGPVDRP